MPNMNTTVSNMLVQPTHIAAGPDLVQVLEKQFRGSLSAFPALVPAAEKHLTAEMITRTAFMNIDELSQDQLADLRAGTAAVDALWAAICDTPFWHNEAQWPLRRCILMALCLQDILHKCGRPDARLFRSGLDIRQGSGDFPRMLMIGDPTAPRLEGMWNAHMAVRLGDFLLDPSFGQTKRFWNRSPHCAAFLAAAPAGHMLEIEPGKRTPSLVLHRYSADGHAFQVSYFKLSRKVDLRTRNWRNAPDARPERRSMLVHKAVTIHQAQRAEATRTAA
jgi:hypothetical protein